MDELHIFYRTLYLGPSGFDFLLRNPQYSRESTGITIDPGLQDEMSSNDVSNVQQLHERASLVVSVAAKIDKGGGPRL